MASPPDPDPTDQPNRTLLGDYLRAQCAVIAELEPELVRHLRTGPGGDPTVLAVLPATAELAELVEVVHDIRVAIRRLRSTVRTFAPALSPAAAALADEAAWFADALGALRDLDIVEERADADLNRLSDGPDAELLIGDVRGWLTDGLAERRARARIALTVLLAGDRYAALRAEFARWGRSPDWSADVDEVDLDRCRHQSARRAKKRLKRATKAAQADPELPDLGEIAHLLHQARKATKRHRYAVEVLAAGDGSAEVSTTPTSPKKAARLKDRQDRLGKIQDSTVSQQLLLELGTQLGRRSGRNGFGFGVLTMRERDVQRASIGALVGIHAS